MRSDRPGAVIGSIGTFGPPGGSRVCARPVLIVMLISLIASFALGACAPTASRPGPREAGAISPTGHPPLIAFKTTRGTSPMPCRAGRGAERHVRDDPYALYDRSLTERSFSDEFSHIPLRALARRSRGRSKPGHRAQAPLDNARLVVELDTESSSFLVRPSFRQGRRQTRCRLS